MESEYFEERLKNPSNFDKNKYPLIGKSKITTELSFKVYRDIEEKYRFDTCHICGGEAYLEYGSTPNKNDNKFFCARCGTYVISKFVNFLDYDHDYWTSLIFNYFAQHKNNIYWENDKTVVVSTIWTGIDVNLSKYELYSDDKYDLINYAELKSKFSESTDDLLTKITENIGFCLSKAGEYFSIGDGIDKITSIVFFIKFPDPTKDDDICNAKSLLCERLKWLVEENLLSEIKKKDDSRVYYTLTKKGWDLSCGHIKLVEKNEDKPQIITNIENLTYTNKSVMVGNDSIITKSTVNSGVITLKDQQNWIAEHPFISGVIISLTAAILYTLFNFESIINVLKSIF